jgi:predicted Rdx family selenoprotein
LNKVFGVWAQVVPGDRGAFEVNMDDQVVFSKLQLDRFPNDGEIVELLRSEIDNPPIRDDYNA